MADKLCELCVWWTWIGNRYACCIGCCRDYERWEPKDEKCVRIVKNLDAMNVFTSGIEMNDLISRQAALDALEWKWAGKAALDAIKALPSAEPESCEYWDAESNYCALNRPSAQPEPEHTMEEFMYGQDMGNPEDGSL